MNFRALLEWVRTPSLHSCLPYSPCGPSLTPFPWHLYLLAHLDRGSRGPARVARRRRRSSPASAPRPGDPAGPAPSCHGRLEPALAPPPAAASPSPALGSSREVPHGAVRGCTGLIQPCGPSGRSPTPGCAAARPSGLGNPATGRGAPCDEEQSRQAVGRAARTRRSWGSTMAAAVRAAGGLPTLCGAATGESPDAERGLKAGLPDGEQRGSSRRALSRPDPLCDLARARTLSES